MPTATSAQCAWCRLFHPFPSRHPEVGTGQGCAQALFEALAEVRAERDFLGARVVEVEKRLHLIHDPVVEEYEARAVRIEAQMRAMLLRIKEMRRAHDFDGLDDALFDEEDIPFRCPALRGKVCACGADEFNAELDALFSLSTS